MPYHHHQNRHRSSDSGLITVALLLIAGVLWQHRSLFAAAMYLMVVLFALVLLIMVARSHKWLRFHRQPASITKVDTMDGLEFEKYVAASLPRLGYTNISLTERYDSGVDVIAEMDGERWGIQVKRYKNEVKADAVRQVVTALKLYGCQRAMVVTNSHFSNVAQRLANSNECVLIDRAELMQIISGTA